MALVKLDFGYYKMPPGTQGSQTQGLCALNSSSQDSSIVLV